MDKVQEKLSKMSADELFETFEVYSVYLDDQISFKGTVEGKKIEVFVDNDDSNIVECVNATKYLLEDPEDIEDEQEVKVMHDMIREFYCQLNDTLDWDLFWKQLPEIIKNGKYEILYDETELL